MNNVKYRKPENNTKQDIMEKIIVYVLTLIMVTMIILHHW